MEAHENDYVSFPIHDEIQESVVSHEEVCEPSEDCILPDNLSGVAVEEEEQHQYTSGDDESMAVEALRQLGGMYPCFEDKKINCPKCSRQFNQAEFQSHSESCTSGKLCCSTCNERFERKQDLNNHMVCHQVDRPHACRTCGSLFRSKSHLQTHMTQVHKAEKPHKCTICGSDFHRPSSLSNHMKIHTYVAGRALVQTETSSQSENETSRKWGEDNRNTGTTGGYEVHWSVPYNFDPGVESISGNPEKMDTLQEFTVMPNGEVTHFEYTSQESITPPVNRYNLAINNFTNSESCVKIENLPFATIDSKTYPEYETSDGGVKSYSCTQCGANFSKPTALASHAKTHMVKTWSMPIECQYCDKQFQDSTHLSSHQTTCAKKLMQANLENGVTNGKWGKHACTECGKKFTTKQKMFRHQWIHRKKTHACEICGSQFEKQNQLDEHRLSAHPGDSPFTCTECGKSFVSRQGLWEHGRTHAGSPAHFHCDTCSKTFSSRQGYLIHHRTHTGERPYGCKFCWKAFRDGGTLRKHERIHTGERPHVCPLCSRAFNQKVVLREHVRWVHAAGKNETEVSGPPYPCPLCGSLNQDRDELCAHIVKHSDQMIAEAKAKTNNNATKTKAAKKRTKPMTTDKSAKAGHVERSISRNEEEAEALLSIPTDSAEDEVAPMILKDQEIEEQLLLVTGDKNLVSISSKQEKRNDQPLLVPGQTAIITKIRQTDVLQLIQNAKRNETLRLISSGKPNNTLHLITKQNQSLPVLAIRNPQSHDNFSSQMPDPVDPRIAIDNEHIPDNNLQEGCLMDDETSHVSAEQVAQLFHQHERQESDNDDGDEEMVCGICGDDFDDKNVLMEHVKIHI
ncbi:zinc finger protein 595-like isoform X2 [Venturia canescens]|uniref:zinc finger protein 595-like isoform X2 n=1 Tax=Venturia canescens TaxID=32260 RepID=UPI001C9D1F26|nr:zinc finger protein 595-like isoform X2 [Venturia canescens]